MAKLTVMVTSGLFKGVISLILVEEAIEHYSSPHEYCYPGKGCKSWTKDELKELTIVKWNVYMMILLTNVVYGMIFPFLIDILAYIIHAA